MSRSMAGAEAAVAAVREAIKPGVSENDLFAIMYHEVIRQGGEFIETRLLTSGQRTNPWFNEASGRKIRPGELVALDTDTIGCYGYYSDFSRTFRCGPGKPTAYQKSLYRMAHDQVQHNIVDREAGHGISRDRREGLEDSRALRRAALHLGDAWRRHAWRNAVHRALPWTTPPTAAMAYLVPGMVVSVESYIGEKGGREGVKLEDEILITDTGTELLSRFPYEDEFLNGQADCEFDETHAFDEPGRLRRSSSTCRRSIDRTSATLSTALTRFSPMSNAFRPRRDRMACRSTIGHMSSIWPQRPAFHPVDADGRSAFATSSDPLTAICPRKHRPMASDGGQGGKPAPSVRALQRRPEGARDRVADRCRRLDRGLRRRHGQGRDRRSAFAFCW